MSQGCEQVAIFCATYRCDQQTQAPRLRDERRGLTISALAAEPTLFPLWNTVSPNGQYAIGWSTPGSTKKLPQPYETDSGLENWLINVRTRERIVKLPNSLYWSLPSGTRPNHYDLVAAWASDSSAAV
jgi:hypothetical protein